MRLETVSFPAQWITKFALATFLLLSAGCAGPQTYRYADHILIPPNLKQATVAQRTVKLPVEAQCEVSDGGIQFAAAKTIRVTVQPDKLVAHPQGWLQQWAEKLEEQGCVADGTGFALASRVTEIVPIDPNAASNLLRSPGLAYRDLSSEYRLYGVGPILREGAKPNAPAIVSTEAAGDGAALTVTVKASPDLVGVETSWYGIQPKADHAGAKIVFLSAEDRIGYETTHPDKPRLDYLHFSDRAAYFRFFLHTADSQSDHLAIVLAASTRAELREQTRRLEADAQVCAKAAALGLCVEAPFGNALSPALLATVNGREVAIRDRWTVRGALQASGLSEPQSALATLEVKRFYDGRLVPVVFDRTRSDILDLPLAGREEIRWRP